MSKNRTPIFSARARADCSAHDRARRSATVIMAIDDRRVRGEEKNVGERDRDAALDDQPIID